MRARFISRFERRILVAMFLAGIAPFLIAVAFIPRIIEAQFSLLVNLEVRDAAETAALFYKEFFRAKRREFGARAETIARDPVLRDATAAHAADDIRARLEQFLADNEDIREISVLNEDESPLFTLAAQDGRAGGEFQEKRVRLPIGLGEAPLLEVAFLVPLQYFKEQERAAEIAEQVDNAFRAGDALRRDAFRLFAAITFGVLLLSLAAGYVLARRVTKRVARVAAATEDVARGDLEVQIPLRGDDEITELTAAFNKMVAEISSSRDRIVYLEKVSGWQEFARRLAHEIKNPLTPIQLAVQELHRRAPEGDPAFRKLVDDAAGVVEEEIGALTRLVDEFSQFARLPEVSPDRVELKAYVEDFLSAYNRFEPDATVTLSLPAGEILASIDRVLMKRVLYNLCLNAIEAAGKGKARLWLTLRPLLSGETEIRIEDNGPGVPTEAAERIFDPYFTTKSEGTGLGLAIVKKIILQHGGTIALAPPEQGTGAAFVITLPR